MSRRHHVEQYQDRLARLYPEEAIPTKDGQKSLTRTVTFQVTDACNLACTYCVSPDTMILLSDMTYKPIKDIRLEDELITFDENTGIFDSHTKVEQIYNREVDELYEITFDDTHMLKITGNHKVFRMNGNTNEWIEAKDLNVGDFIYYFDVKVPYSGHFTRKITHINKLTGTFEVFNLGTSTKTYFANGLAVHNCYQINKDKHSMPFEVAKKFFDMLVEADSESCDYINPDNSPGLIVEFIGGEPFMEIDLISQISDYVMDTIIKKKHKWANRFMFSICSNGVLYFDKRVQEYINKHKDHLSFSISIDGNKKLHDSCRIFPNGQGSYDIAIAGVKHFREHYHGYMGSKMTLAPQNIAYAYDAVTNLVALDYDDIYLNCVYEEGWTDKDAHTLYEQLKKIADFLIEDEERFEEIFLSIFDETSFCPKSITDNDNWCGGTGAMISVDWKGDIYPCIRYMESSLGSDIPPLKIGNVNDGIMVLSEHIKTVNELRSITRRSQSDDECFYCPIAGSCSWCSAYNYQVNGTANKRTKFLCQMHKARTLANAYLWNKGNRKYHPDRRFKLWIPKEWALQIIDEAEWQMLKDLESVTAQDKLDIYNFRAKADGREQATVFDPLTMGNIKPEITNGVDFASSDISLDDLLNVDLEAKKIIFGDRS